MLPAGKKKLSVEKLVSVKPECVPLTRAADLKRQYDFFARFAVEAMRYPYVSTQLRATYKEDSTELSEVECIFVGFLNSDTPIDDMCRFKVKGAGANRHRPPFQPMDRFILSNDRPMLNPWELHVVCYVVYTDTKIVVTFMKASKPVIPDVGLVFKFLHDEVREIIKLDRTTSEKELLAAIVERIKVPLFKANNKTLIVNEGPFPVWKKPRKDGSEQDHENWALVERTRHEYNAFLKWLTPFPLIENGKGMSGRVMFILTGGIMSISPRGLIPMGRQSPYRPESMFFIPGELSMPKENPNRLGVMPDHREQPIEYDMFMVGGCINKETGERYPICGRPIAPPNKNRKIHETLLQACVGNLSTRQNVLRANMEIVISWPKTFVVEAEKIRDYEWGVQELAQFDWLDCQVGPFKHYLTKVHSRRTVPLSVAEAAGPIATEKTFRYIQFMQDMTGIISKKERCTYVKVDYCSYGDTFPVYAFCNSDAIICKLRTDILVKPMEPKLAWTMVPPVSAGFYNAETMKGATLYLVDRDSKEIHVKGGKNANKPKIVLKEGLAGVYGYYNDRGLRIVTEVTVHDPIGIVPPVPLDAMNLLAVADPKIANQAGCVGSKQERPFDEDITKYIVKKIPQKQPKIMARQSVLNVYNAFKKKKPTGLEYEGEPTFEWTPNKYARTGTETELFRRPRAMMEHVALKYRDYYWGRRIHF